MPATSTPVMQPAKLAGFLTKFLEGSVAGKANADDLCLYTMSQERYGIRIGGLHLKKSSVERLLFCAAA